MNITIIPSDKAVYKDGDAYLNLDLSFVPDNIHALQWKDNLGWIEFTTNNDGTKPENQQITVLPDWVNNAIAAWQTAYDDAHKPAPDPLPPTAEQNKQTASSLLSETDWTTIPAVSDPQKSNPYLLNPDEFLAYRNILRAIAINPTEGFITWPAKPSAKWS